MADSPSTSTNPIRDFAQNPELVHVTDDDLLVDGVYSIDDLRLFFDDEEKAEQVDTRWYESTVVKRKRRSRAGSGRVKRRKGRKQRGASFPARPGGTTEKYIVRLRLDRKVRFNKIRFELLNVPLNWSVWYKHERTGNILPLRAKNRKRVEGTLAPNKFIRRRFKTIRMDTKATRTGVIEIRLDRNVPLSQLSGWWRRRYTQFPYRLRIRDVDVRWSVDRPEDLPPDDEEVNIPHPIGFVEQIVTEEWSADKAIDGNLQTYWMSGPQAHATAIVPYYIDVRGADGSPVLFDRLELHPVFGTGASLNLYWSDDDAVAIFRLSRVSLDGTLEGNASFVDSEGVLFGAVGDALSFQNDTVRVDTSRDFVFGCVWKPSFASSSSPVSAAPLFTLGDGTNSIVVRWNDTADTIQVGTDSSPTFYFETAGALTFSADDELVVVVGYNYTNDDSLFPSNWYVTFGLREGTLTKESGEVNPPAGFIPSEVVFGSDESRAADARGTIYGVWLRQEGYVDKVAEAFSENTEDFAQGAGSIDDLEGSNQRIHGDYNAVLRGMLWNSTRVRAGPGEGYYDAKEWVPIPRDFTLSRMVYHFNPVRAKFLKLEFSNLTPRITLMPPEGMFLPWRKYPVSVRNYYRRVWEGYPGSAARELVETTVPVFRDVAPSSNLLRDELEEEGARVLKPGYLPEVDEESLNLDSELDRQSIRQRFWRSGVHNYDVEHRQVEHQEAYFVGLRELSVYQVDFVVAEDTPEYFDTFLNEANVDTGSTTMTWNSQGYYSSTASGEEVVTKTFNSMSNWRTLQFAAHTSDWITLMGSGQMNLEVPSLAEGGSDPNSPTYDQDVVDELEYNPGTGDGFLVYQNAVVTRETDNVRGEGAGEVLGFVPSGSGEYGVITAPGIFQTAAGGDEATYDSPVSDDPYDEPQSYDGAEELISGSARTSAMARVYLPETARGTYELRIVATDDISSIERVVAVTSLKVPRRTWHEIEVGYISDPNDTDFRAELVQVDDDVNEQFFLDFIGVFQHPVRWDISNDAGVTWNPILHTNNPQGYFSLASGGNELRIRAVALQAGVVVGGYTAVPWYIDSPLVQRIPIDYIPPWGQSDEEDLRATDWKPFFQLWNRLYPQKHSLIRVDRFKGFTEGSLTP